MEFKDKQAIYLQIADYFCEKILQKKWKANDRIPSVREMAVSTEVNPNTVVRTYTYLQDKGIIYNKRGIGYFVSDDAFKITKELVKESFIESSLPEVFKTLELLQLEINDLVKYYEKYKSA